MFQSALLSIIEGDIVLDTDDIRVALVGASHSSDADADTVVGDANTLDECDRGSYARVALANEATTREDGSDRVIFTSDDITTFGDLEVGFTVAGAIFYKHVTNDSDSPLLWFYDLTNTPTNGEAFGLDKHGDGHWMKFTRV